MSLELWTGFVVGILGSIHCIGMCGPIALALPSGFPTRTQLLVSRLLYNAGRVLTYAALGAVSGLLGKTIVMAGFQRSLSIAGGVVILIMVLLPTRFAHRLLPMQAVGRFAEKIRAIWGKLFQERAMRSLFAIGILNGFLPCGFLYVGLAAAATTGGIMSGSAYMMLFGLGTVPSILATSLFGGLLTMRIRRYFLRLLPVGSLILASLLILRGLSLGIPYVSPNMDKQTTTQHPCCH
ncbi:hypothetical protein C3F09_04380 [candidate division GN15 bacterium]|uniref:Urease accessory protein UreH-like transmembrane domain-containing protein n=1 Tax=candidate division GN15 bacterium TaxID=2072418 RepID=A0A855X2J1_9BACT|nr:MAG: hypothetical protein C3F09_04380 [candidate division GN15 bacterium]